MRSFVRFLAWLSLILGLLLCLVGLTTLPAGGLMFALPAVFLLPGIALTVLGALVLLFSRKRAARHG